MGTLVGALVVGLGVGAIVGVLVGKLVPVVTGALVGDLVGLFVGALVGLLVGALVVLMVGAEVTGEDGGPSRIATSAQLTNCSPKRPDVSPDAKGMVSAP